jgi:UDP:flavonoid glycosyltransferase YjiC (YdhE family)
VRVLETLARTEYNEVAAYTTILGDDELLAVGGSVLLRCSVPAESVSRMVDLSVLHGGQGTFYAAAYARRPVVGVPMQVEQQFNPDILVRNRSALRVSRRRFRPRELLAAIETILGSYEAYRERAEASIGGNLLARGGGSPVGVAIRGR